MERFRGQILDVDKFVKVNDCQCISNPVVFQSAGKPTPDGLLSDKIFGITHGERYGIYGYIDLGGEFLNPLCYKRLVRLNGKIKGIIHGIQNYSITESGELVEDMAGGTGIKWLKKNFDKIVWSRSTSDIAIESMAFIKLVNDQKLLWMSKMPVIPPGYRDVVTTSKGVGIGELNQLYQSLIMATNQYKQAADFGLTLMDVSAGRIQDLIASIFDWFGNGTTIGREKTSKNLPGKTGLIRRGILAKTTDFCCRSVITAANNKAEDLDDMMCDMYHATIPLAIAITCFKPFIIFWLRRFFEKEFAGRHNYDIVINDTETGEKISVSVPIKDYQMAFSDAELESQIDRFVKGRFNRLIPIKIPVERTEWHKVLVDKFGKERASKAANKPIYMMLHGTKVPSEVKLKDWNDMSPDERIQMEITQRKLTWADLFYMAAVEMAEDKCVVITRFPMDSYFNQFPQMVRVITTTKTRPMVVDGKYYRWYPIITDDMIGKNTSSTFVDTISISNPTIGTAGGDFDGDTVTCKPVYSIEANNELKQFLHSKGCYHALDGAPAKKLNKEGIICLYSLTNCPDEEWDNKLNKMEFA